MLVLGDEELEVLLPWAVSAIAVISALTRLALVVQRGRTHPAREEDAARSASRARHRDDDEEKTTG